MRPLLSPFYFMEVKMSVFDYKTIEKKWQKFWEDNETFKTDVNDFSKPKFYALDMFPYPSGVGLQIPSVYRRSSMQYRPAIIRPDSPRRISIILPNSSRAWVSLTTGQRSFPLPIRITTSGHSGSSNSSSWTVMQDVSRCRSTGVKNWAASWPMMKSLTASRKEAVIRSSART